MSNRPRKRPRVLTADQLFPKRTPASIFDQIFTAAKMRAPHKIDLVEIGPRIYEVRCTIECGFVAPAYGEEHAARIKENHYARFHVIHDPLGAKYRD
jgi:hypothetical protein